MRQSFLHSFPLKTNNLAITLNDFCFKEYKRTLLITFRDFIIILFVFLTFHEYIHIVTKHKKSGVSPLDFSNINVRAQKLRKNENFINF